MPSITCGGIDDEDERTNRSGLAAITSWCARRGPGCAWCIVGTAVYQVGRASLIQAKNLQRVEARRAEDQAAGRQRGEQAGHQAVDVKQRHHVQSPRSSAVSRSVCADVARRGADVALAERHELRAATWCRRCAA